MDPDKIRSSDKIAQCVFDGYKSGTVTIHDLEMMIEYNLSDDDPYTIPGIARDVVGRIIKERLSNGEDITDLLPLVRTGRLNIGAIALSLGNTDLFKRYADRDIAACWSYIVGAYNGGICPLNTRIRALVEMGIDVDDLFSYMLCKTHSYDKVIVKELLRVCNIDVVESNVNGRYANGRYTKEAVQFLYELRHRDDV